MAGCERAGKAGIKVVAAERTVVSPSVVSEGIKQPATYFEKTIDWQAGATNPNITRIQEIIQQRREHPTLFSIWGAD